MFELKPFVSLQMLVPYIFIIGIAASLGMPDQAGGGVVENDLDLEWVLVGDVVTVR